MISEKDFIRPKVNSSSTSWMSCVDLWFSEPFFTEYFLQNLLWHCQICLLLLYGQRFLTSPQKMMILIPISSSLQFNLPFRRCYFYSTAGQMLVTMANSTRASLIHVHNERHRFSTILVTFGTFPWYTKDLESTSPEKTYGTLTPNCPQQL